MASRIRVWAAVVGRMARLGWRDASELLAGDVVKGLLFAAVSLLLTGLLTHDWVVAAIVGIVPGPFVFLVVFAVQFVQNAYRNKRWEPEVEVNLAPETPQLIFSLRSKVGSQPIGDHRCEVKAPSGMTYTAEGLGQQAVDSVWFGYPKQGFTDAEGPVSGRYDVTWRERSSRGKWLEIVHRSHDLIVEK